MLIFVLVHAVYNLQKQRRKKKKEKKKVNVPVTGRHAVLSLVVFVPILYTVYVLFMTMLLGVYIDGKGLCYKMCYKKKIYYPVCCSLPTINHSNILTGHQGQVTFVPQSKEKKNHSSALLRTHVFLGARFVLQDVSFFKNTSSSAY